MKRSADEAWGDISRIDTEGLRKMERGMVEDFNRQFDDLPKSRRAEKLYAIMKVKGELAKRDKKKTMNDKQAAKDTLKEVRKNQSSVIKEAKSILDDAVGGKLKWGKTEAGTWGTLDNGENDHLLGDLSLELEKWGNLKIWDMVEGKVIKTFGSQSSMFEDSIKKFFKEQKGSDKADESLSEKKSRLQKELREMEQIHGLRERGKAWKDFNERAEFRRDMNKKQHEIDDVERQMKAGDKDTIEDIKNSISKLRKNGDLSSGSVDADVWIGTQGGLNVTFKGSSKAYGDGGTKVLTRNEFMKTNHGKHAKILEERLKKFADKHGLSFNVDEDFIVVSD